jgi:hypothetical protein
LERELSDANEYLGLLTSRLDGLEEAMVANSTAAKESMKEVKLASSSREKIVDYSLDKIEERLSWFNSRMDDMAGTVVRLEDENRVLKGMWVCRCDFNTLT